MKKRKIFLIVVLVLIFVASFISSITTKHDSNYFFTEYLRRLH